MACNADSKQKSYHPEWYTIESRDLLEIIEARAGKSSTIFCSQFDIPGWREKIGDPIVADAICDRIVHNSYKIIMESKESMRKLKEISND